MSVLIKGISLPDVLTGDMKIRIKVGGSTVVTWDGMVGGLYPEVIELPDHGDLIDRDALIATDSWEWIRHDAPVVIPAERSEE